LPTQFSATDTTNGTKMNVAVKFFTFELYLWTSHALILTGFFMHFQHVTIHKAPIVNFFRNSSLAFKFTF